MAYKKRGRAAFAGSPPRRRPPQKINYQKAVKIIREDKMKGKGFGMNESTLTKLNELTKIGNTLPKFVKDGMAVAALELASRGVSRVVNLNKIGSIENSVSIGKRIGPQELQWHKTNLYMGKPNPSAVRRLAANNGTTMKWMADTNKEAASAGYTFEFGFNRKIVAVWNTATHLLNTDYNSAFLLNDNIWPTNTVQRAYGTVLCEKLQYKFSNRNKYFPVVLRIDFIRPETDVDTMHEVFNLAVNTDENVQLNGRIPKHRQSSNHLLTGDQKSAEIDPSITLNASSTYRGMTQTVKTITRTLQPGEVWTVNTTISLGSGIRLADLREAHNDEANGVPTIAPVIYAHGKDCEMITDADGSSNIGTSPGSITVEMKKGMEYVNAGILTTPTATDQGFAPAQPLVRVFTSDAPPLSNSKLFSVANSSIGTPGVDAYYCPVMSDMVEKYAKVA